MLSLILKERVRNHCGVSAVAFATAEPRWLHVCKTRLAREHSRVRGSRSPTKESSPEKGQRHTE